MKPGPRPPEGGGDETWGVKETFTYVILFGKEVEGAVVVLVFGWVGLRFIHNAELWAFENENQDG